MREFIQRNVKSRRTGEVVSYKYSSIAGVPIQEYFRDRERKRYVKRPRTEAQPHGSDKLTSQIKELHAQGVSQCEIARRLNVSRYQVQRELGVR
jgi:DNA-binding NarL/FixJ family response regulator